MSTSYYLADPRFMTEDEMDRDILLCHATGRDSGWVFSPTLDNISFFNLPRDIQLKNDNSSPISTVGELIDLAREKGNKIIPIHQAEKEQKEIYNDWYESKKNDPAWQEVINCQPASSSPMVKEYIERVKKMKKVITPCPLR